MERGPRNCGGVPNVAGSGLEPTALGHREFARFPPAPIPRRGTDPLGGAERRDRDGRVDLPASARDRHRPRARARRSAHRPRGYHRNRPRPAFGRRQGSTRQDGRRVGRRERQAGAARRVVAGGRAPQGRPQAVQEHGRIDWTASASAVHNLVRGMNPFPGAWTTLLDGTTLRVHATTISDVNFDGEAGTVHATKTELHVQCGEGAVSSCAYKSKANLPWRPRTFSTAFALHFVPWDEDLEHALLPSQPTMSAPFYEHAIALIGRHLNNCGTGLRASVGACVLARRSGDRAVDVGAGGFGLHLEPGQRLQQRRMARDLCIRELRRHRHREQRGHSPSRQHVPNLGQEELQSQLQHLHSWWRMERSGKAQSQRRTQRPVDLAGADGVGIHAGQGLRRPPREPRSALHQRRIQRAVPQRRTRRRELPQKAVQARPRQPMEVHLPCEPRRPWKRP